MEKLRIGQTVSVQIGVSNAGDTSTREFITIEQNGCLAGGGVALARNTDFAAIIIRACNAHDELVEALKSLRREYISVVEAGVERIRALGGDVDDAPRTYEGGLEIAGVDAALAKAEGK